MVRAKFRVESIARTMNGGHTVTLSAIMSRDSEENKAFWKFTPYGSISLNTVNDSAMKAFGDPGDEFYVDFSPAEKPAEKVVIV